MPSSKPRKSRYSRRFALLVLLVAAAVAGYTVFWFQAARTLETEAVSLVKELNRNGVRANCEEAEARGYPFRIGLFCRSVFYEDVRDGISVNAGAFRSAAQFYQPRRVIGELDGPARITLPLIEPLQARWEILRASTHIATPLPERVSAEARRVVLAYDDDEATPLAEIASAEFHARQNGANLDIAARFEALDMSTALAGGAELPLFDGEADATIDDGVASLADGRSDLRGTAGTIRLLRISADGSDAMIALSGPVSVRENGLIDAELKVTIRNVPAVSAILAEAFPEARHEIGTAAGALSSLGDTAELPVRITGGRVSLGFIPLGRIPPL